MTKPSSTTKRLLGAIRENPRGSYREWMDAAGISSSAVIRHHLHKLERAGLVRLHPGQPRSVELTGEDLEYWKEQAMRARRSARAWKASAKGWRAAAQIECVIDDESPVVRSV